MIYQSGMMSHQNAIQRAGTTPSQMGATTSPMCAAPHVARTHAHFGAGTPITPAAAMHVGLQCAATPMSAPQFFCGQDMQNGTMMGQNATLTHLRPSASSAASQTMFQASMPGVCQPGGAPGVQAAATTSPHTASSGPSSGHFSMESQMGQCARTPFSMGAGVPPMAPHLVGASHVAGSQNFPSHGSSTVEVERAAQMLRAMSAGGQSASADVGATRGDDGTHVGCSTDACCCAAVRIAVCSWIWRAVLRSASSWRASSDGSRHEQPLQRMLLSRRAHAQPHAESGGACRRWHRRGHGTLAACAARA